jgi:hypothetical protein
MSTGRNILLNDPNQNHTRLSNEQVIHSSQELNELNHSLLRDVNMYRVVCVCCNDPSPVINQVQSLESVIAVWSCKEHSGSESNPTFNTKVRDRVSFDPHGDGRLKWLFEAHKLLFEAYYKSRNRDEYQMEKQILKQIQIQRQSSCESQSSVDATDQSDVDLDDISFGEELE